MEVEKIAHHLGVDQQRGVEYCRVGCCQRLQFVFKFGQQFVR